MKKYEVLLVRTDGVYQLHPLLFDFIKALQKAGVISYTNLEPMNKFESENITHFVLHPKPDLGNQVKDILKYIIEINNLPYKIYVGIS